MKIVAGLGSIDEYIPYVKAGADELFCGYVPESWSEKYGTMLPLNRREVLYYNVQIGAMSELKILRSMMDVYGVPVKLTFNSLFYLPEQYPEIAGIIVDCIKNGFDTFIIADPALVLYLRKNRIPCRIHLSGELSEVNRPMIESFLKMDVQRIIFHRKNTIEDMHSCISYIQKQCEETGIEAPEYESFVLNEMCHFTGAFCNSLHCDELPHLCRVPYWLGDRKTGDSTMNEERIQNNLEQEEMRQDEELDEYQTGSSGCGLCALPELRSAGVTNLKLVGRGGHVLDMRQDIMQLKKALDLLEEYPDLNHAEQYQNRMKELLLEHDCSHVCYYR